MYSRGVLNGMKSYSLYVFGEIIKKGKGRLWRDLVIVAFICAILEISPHMVRILAENLGAVKVLFVLSLLDDPYGYWYGAGLRSDDHAAKGLIWRAYKESANSWISCAEEERIALENANSSIFDKFMHRTDSVMWLLIHVRQQECAGLFVEALETLNQEVDLGRLDVQRISLLRYLGQDNDATEIVLDRLCSLREDWCVWCVLESADHDQQQIEATVSDGVIRRNNVNETGYRREDMKTIERMIRKSAPNVVLESEAPLVIRGVPPRSQADNYLNYETIPVIDSIVRLRVRGVVMGSADLDCIVNPRLVLWSDGTYHGELEARYSISGRFDVDLWGFLPDKTTDVTPRIAFDGACFVEGQRVAICDVEFAVQDRSR